MMYVSGLGKEERRDDQGKEVIPNSVDYFASRQAAKGAKLGARASCPHASETLTLPGSQLQTDCS